MTDTNGYGKLSYGRTAPGERQVSVRKRPELHAIPARERLLMITCAAGRGRQPFLIAVVKTDGQLMPTGGHLVAGAVLATKCSCAAKAHHLDHGKIIEAVDRLRHRPPKARVVDVQQVLAQ